MGIAALKPLKFIGISPKKTLDECKRPLDKLDEYLYLSQSIYEIEKRRKSALGSAHRTKMEGFAQLKGVIFGLGCVCTKLAVSLKDNTQYKWQTSKLIIIQNFGMTSISSFRQFLMEVSFTKTIKTKKYFKFNMNA